MTFQQIKYVMKIAECGSINKATQKLFVAQPYLSSKLKDLEKEIGIVLFTRSNKGVVLTNEGKEFLSYVAPLFEQREKIVAMYSEQNRELPVRFRISSQRHPFIVQAFLKYYHSKNFEKYEFYVKEVGMYDVIDDIFERKSEMGIIFISEVSKKLVNRVLQSKGIEFEELKNITPCVLIHKNHVMSNKDVITIQEIQSYPYVVFERENGASIEYSEEIALYDFRPDSRIIFVADRASMYNVLAHSNGFAIGSGILPNGFADESLCAIPIANHKNDIKLGWIKLKNTPMTTEMMEFLNYLKELLREEL